ncbi:EAL domain-containing protein [Ramlibacter sp. 2FC]|uniref:EAL domain-containing response regulator n=1 Tax=Ramlibacter sp. 2FC TaxID=2502188 RepID=UPI0010F837AC|nr:EAL domain-containing protein [Ramlibacter sp. 2FC]
MILPDQPHTDARILIVDDNPTNVALLVDILDDAGFSDLESTTNPFEAVERFVQGQHDLILLDIRMPGMDGFAVMRALRERLQGDEYLPVLVLTAHADHPTRLAALEAGARDFVSKPFDAGEVLLRIRNLLEVRALHNHRRIEAERLEILVAERTAELSERKRHLAYLASHDTLTGLPNAHALLECLDARLAEPETRFSLVLLELAGHRRLDNLEGHTFGEQVLSAAAKLLQQALAPLGVWLTHWRSAKFVIVVDDAESEAALERLRARVLDCIARPLAVGGYEMLLDARFGVVQAPAHGSASGELLRRASLALASGLFSTKPPLTRFSLAQEGEIAKRHRLEKALRGALARGEIALHYQPKYSWTENAVVGAEALMRWNHPEFGPVPPMRFIPLAEETGLIAELGLWAIEQALSDVARWSAEAGRQMAVAVNVSARQFELMRSRGDSLSDQVRLLIARAGVAPEMLELEITESAIMADFGYVLEELNRLRALGVRLAIDDFGTGYSSLAYLRNLPVNTLKIDRAFVHGMAANDDAQSLARTVVAMGKALHLEVVAEGVETGAEATALQALGCDLAQGWLYGRPMPADQLPSMRLARAA